MFKTFIGTRWTYVCVYVFYWILSKYDTPIQNLLYYRISLTSRRQLNRKIYPGPNNCRPECHYCMSCRDLSVLLSVILSVIVSICHHGPWPLSHLRVSELYDLTRVVHGLSRQSSRPFRNAHNLWSARFRKITYVTGYVTVDWEWLRFLTLKIMNKSHLSSTFISRAKSRFILSKMWSQKVLENITKNYIWKPKEFKRGIKKSKSNLIKGTKSENMVVNIYHWSRTWWLEIKIMELELLNKNFKC